ncbi:MAG: hypothetical protein ACTJF6_06215, partial [Microbacteriaceae bacterium]
GVVVGVTTGALVAGIPGALFAVPIIAALNAMVNTLVEGKWRGDPDPVALFHAEHAAKQDLKVQTKLRNKVMKQLQKKPRPKPEPTAEPKEQE